MTPVIFSLDNSVFRSFALCSGILGGKLLLNSLWTSYNRGQQNAHSTPEDCAYFGDADSKVDSSNPVVERTRRMHLNDLENCTPFFLLGLLYVSTEPDESEAKLLFRVSYKSNDFSY